MTPTAPPTLTTMPLPQLAELLRAQFSPSQRQELVELLVEAPAAEEEFSLADDLRAAAAEIKLHREGKKTFRAAIDIVHELSR